MVLCRRDRCQIAKLEGRRIDDHSWLSGSYSIILGRRNISWASKCPTLTRIIEKTSKARRRAMETSIA